MKFNIFKKQPAFVTELEVVETGHVETFKKEPVEAIREKYGLGANIQQLADEYELSVEDILEIVGA